MAFRRATSRPRYSFGRRRAPRRPFRALRGPAPFRRTIFRRSFRYPRRYR